MFGDIKYGVIAAFLCVAYCALFLGSCSPLHCRAKVALAGIFCIILACASGFGICFIYDWKGSEMTTIVPVLMLGIGVDDMFVICNAID